MKCVIRACQKRKWFVDWYISQELYKQGLSKDDVITFTDTAGLGNLKSFIAVCRYVIENNIGDAWFLQDDVLLRSDFVNTCKNMRKDMIINGFVYADSEGNDNYKYILEQQPKRYWFSFPCCYIPMRYIKGFLDWFYMVLKSHKYEKMISKNLYDDFFFWVYIQEKHPNDSIFNACPNLVNHIDYLLGGSTLQYQKSKIRPALYWDEPERIDEIKAQLERREKDESYKIYD